MAIGGSLKALSLKGRSFPIAADADATVNIGGYTNEVQANGDGSTRIVKTRIPWSATGIAVEIDHARGDLEFLQEIAADTDNVAVALTYVDDTVYQGRGTITDNVEMSTQNATAPLSLMGPAMLQKQA